ncbi:MAG: hypothetical protein HZA11_13575, partial [Nitrospirae bacterium]|nr:hypothetical protein [Nitrospirota bacterium]
KHIQSYQYHPLFREFLLNLANAIFSQTELSAIQRNAAALMAESGQIENAVLLFRDAGEWEGLTELLLKNAKSLIQEGRNKTLEGWITGIPKDILEKTSWLLYWKGVCRMPFNPKDSLLVFSNAFNLFENGHDRAGMLLSCSGVMESILYAMEDFSMFDRWIERMEKLFKEDASFQSMEIEVMVTGSMLIALALRQPYYPEIGSWIEHAESLLLKYRGAKDRVYFLQFLYIYRGDFARAKAGIKLLKELSKEALPFYKISLKSTEAFYDWLTASYDSCLKRVSEGLDIAEEHAIHVLDIHLLQHGIAAYLSMGDTAGAERLFQKIRQYIGSAGLLDITYHEILSAWHSLLKKDAASLPLHIERLQKYVTNIGMFFAEGIFHIVAAQASHELHKDKQASAHIAETFRISRKMNSRLMEFMAFLTEAQIALDSRKKTQGLNALQKALSLGREKDYWNCFMMRQDVMAILCAIALENGIETEYVEMLIRKRNLLPEKPVENWPYPIKIYTLGRFEIWIDGKPLEFFGKVQKKPLEMLKAIIDMGGEDVPVEKIADKLWPDAEGDMAHSSFEMTLSRLRKLIGSKSIELKGGMASLNPRMVWVDALVKK